MTNSTFTQDTSTKTVSVKVTVPRPLRMETSMRESGIRTRPMAKVAIGMQMAITMRDTGRIIRRMEWVFTLQLTALVI